MTDLTLTNLIEQARATGDRALEDRVFWIYEEACNLGAPTRQALRAARAAITRHATRPRDWHHVDDATIVEAHELEGGETVLALHRDGHEWGPGGAHRDWVVDTVDTDGPDATVVLHYVDGKRSVLDGTTGVLIRDVGRDYPAVTGADALPDVPVTGDEILDQFPADGDPSQIFGAL